MSRTLWVSQAGLTEQNKTGAFTALAAPNCSTLMMMLLVNIIGPSGSGKSTILHVLGKLLKEAGVQFTVQDGGNCSMDGETEWNHNTGYALECLKCTKVVLRTQYVKRRSASNTQGEPQPPTTGVADRKNV